MDMTEPSSQATQSRIAPRPDQTASTVSALVSARNRSSVPTVKTNQANGPNRTSTPMLDQHFVQVIREALQDT